MTDELAELDAVAQAALVRGGEASPLELVDAAIARIEALNPQLNAVIHERFERARAEAAGPLPEGPFTGVPMVVKDLDGVTEGDPYHAGTNHLKRLGYVADHDSYLQARFKAAGLVVVGKTNTPELGLVVTTEPEAHGPTRNPWDTTRSTGGSSGGSAAAVASGMVPIGHAGDGGGSIRIPASECGLVGLFPSRGRHSIGPEQGEAWGGLVRRLAVTRSVRDSAVALDAVSGWMPGDPYAAPAPVRPYVEEVGVEPPRLRIGLRTQPGDPSVVTHPDCVAAAEHVGALLASLGHDVTPADHELLDDAAFQAEFTGHFINALAVWTATELEDLAVLSGEPVTADGVEAGTWALAEMGRQVSGVQFQQALDHFSVFSRRMAAWWADGNDLLLTPTITEPPPELGQFSTTPENPLNGLLRASPIVQFTVPFNVSGQPAISLPLFWNGDGLPIGVQLVAAYGREDLLIEVAAQLEAAQPWADRLPPVHASR
jgi:amidase